MRSPTAIASASPSTSSQRTISSSPPKRATVSLTRSASAIRGATRRSSSSPAPWPRLSLTILKPSRSTKSTAVADPVRREGRRGGGRGGGGSGRGGGPVSGGGGGGGGGPPP